MEGGIGCGKDGEAPLLHRELLVQEDGGGLLVDGDPEVMC